ncbi:MAG: hypothetical protein N2381_09535 [Armatimonadetes bacterium]|nr:hypothetical protein [Armatimonadota bacterium]
MKILLPFIVLLGLAEVQGQVPRRLNNFVTELLDDSPGAVKGLFRYRFVNPRDGWVLFRTVGEVSLGSKILMGVEGVEKAIIVHEHGVNTVEAFRFLRAGEYSIVVDCHGNIRLERVVVRSVPEILFAKFGYDPWVKSFGPYDWSFLKAHMLPHITTVIGTGRKEDAELAKEWKASGRRWMIECGVPGLGDRGEEPTVSAEDAYKYWEKNPGFSQDEYDGVIVDEFLDERANYPSWTAAIQKLAENFKGKVFYPYIGTSGRWFYTSKNGIEFVKTIIGNGFKLVWERYLPEQPTETEAEEFIRRNLKGAVEAWAKSLPNLQQHLIICLGVFSCFPLTLNHEPNVDFKVYLDMQMHHLANDQTFANIYGIMGWTSGYMDEETLRWLGMLYRHYCIEGERTMLSAKYGLQYRSKFAKNADFSSGLSGWAVAQAEEGSIEARAIDGYGWIQGRWPRTKKGDTFLWMRRSPKRPNIVSQEIANLEVGRLYSLKLVVADYNGISQKKTAKEFLPISVRIEGADVIKGFEEVIPTRTITGQWINFYWRLFKAKSNHAKLVISDWLSDIEPGGPPGQELMLNFVEIQPYL